MLINPATGFFFFFPLRLPCPSCTMKDGSRSTRLHSLQSHTWVGKCNHAWRGERSDSHSTRMLKASSFICCDETEGNRARRRRRSRMDQESFFKHQMHYVSSGEQGVWPCQADAHRLPETYGKGRRCHSCTLHRSAMSAHTQMSTVFFRVLPAVARTWNTSDLLTFRRTRSCCHSDGETSELMEVVTLFLLHVSKSIKANVYVRLSAWRRRCVHVVDTLALMHLSCFISWWITQRDVIGSELEGRTSSSVAIIRSSVTNFCLPTCSEFNWNCVNSTQTQILTSAQQFNGLCSVSEVLQQDQSSWDSPIVPHMDLWTIIAVKP